MSPQVMVTTPTAKWLVPLTPFTVNGTSVLTAGWRDATAQGFVPWGWGSTALRFVVINTGSGAITCQPEASYDGQYPEVGEYAPATWTVAPSTCYGDPYGIDEMRPFWRLTVTGTSSGRWGVLHFSRNP